MYKMELTVKAGFTVSSIFVIMCLFVDAYLVYVVFITC